MPSNPKRPRAHRLSSRLRLFAKRALHSEVTLTDIEFLYEVADELEGIYGEHQALLRQNIGLLGDKVDVAAEGLRRVAPKKRGS